MTERTIYQMVTIVVFLIALIVTPATAGRTVGSGSTIYAGEEGLNFVGFGSLGINQPTGTLVHYADPGAGLIDKTITITDAADFDLIPAAVGITTGSYYVFASESLDRRPANAAGYVNVNIPKVKLDVVLSNFRTESVNGKSISWDNSLDFKLMNNLNGLPNGVMNIEVTLPGGGTTNHFGGQSLSGIPVDGSTQYRGTIKLPAEVSGTYTAQAKWPSTSDFYGKGFDSNIVTFEVLGLKATPATGFLYVSSTPVGASVYVDDVYKGVTPLEISGVSAGSHQIKITRSGYYSYTQTTSVTAGTTTPITITLTSLPPTPTPTPTSLPGSGGASTTSGSLDVRSTPSGASIYIDGTYKGVTPKVVSGLSTGPHQVKMIRDGYYDYSLATTVTAGKTNSVLATLTSLPPTPTPTPAPKTTTGSLDIRSTPSGASIYINNTHKGVTPKVVSGLSAGSHQVKVTRNGYRDDTQTVFVTAGGTTPVSATLSAAAVVVSAKPVTGSLTVESDPPGAEIYIDGVYKGVTPRVLSELPAEGYWVTVTKDGYVEDGEYFPGGSTGMFSPVLSPVSTYPTEPLPTAIPSEPHSAGEPFTMFWWLLAIAIVLPAGGLIYVRKRRSAQAGGSNAGGTQSRQSPAGHGGGQTQHLGTTTPTGKADSSVQDNSIPPLKKPDATVVLPGGRSTASTAKPDLTITLSNTSIHADEWNKIGLTLVNTGTTPAFGITLTFSNDVETRLIRPVDLEAGKSITIEAGIKPRTKGKIPLEIIARYRDTGRKAYEQTTSCWLSVRPRNDSAPHNTPVPSSISRPVTPKSLPPEMMERYTAAEFLGRGGFARVFKVQKPDGSWAALKIPISLDAATGKSFIANSIIGRRSFTRTLFGSTTTTSCRFRTSSWNSVTEPWQISKSQFPPITPPGCSSTSVKV